MDDVSTTPEDRFAAIVGEFLSDPDVTPPSRGRTFGSSALKVRQKIFAMLVRGKLVVKLPKTRVDALVESRDGERYDPRHDGRLMSEWVTIEPTSKTEWIALAREALEFVSSKKK
jgi:hypothetical protein